MRRKHKNRWHRIVCNLIALIKNRIMIQKRTSQTFANPLKAHTNTSKPFRRRRKVLTSASIFQLVSTSHTHSAPKKKIARLAVLNHSFLCLASAFFCAWFSCWRRRLRFPQTTQKYNINTENSSVRDFRAKSTNCRKQLNWHSLSMCPLNHTDRRWRLRIHGFCLWNWNVVIKMRFPPDSRASKPPEAHTKNTENWDSINNSSSAERSKRNKWFEKHLRNEKQSVFVAIRMNIFYC